MRCYVINLRHLFIIFIISIVRLPLLIYSLLLMGIIEAHSEKPGPEVFFAHKIQPLLSPSVWLAMGKDQIIRLRGFGHALT